MSANLAKPRKKILDLKVYFDTNTLYSASVHDLVRNEVVELIQSHQNHNDIKVSWIVPAIVRDERKYQMLTKGLELLPSIEKIERLLDHRLNITESVVTTSIDQAIEKKRSNLQIEFLDLDVKRVDWQEIIKLAVFRRPPFQPGEKEKGFRDAVVGETFVQLVEDSPTNAKTCLLAIVSGDGPLKEYVERRCTSRNNIRILSDLEQLMGLINTLVSEATEEFVEGIKQRATEMFFKKEDNSSLYYSHKIGEEIAKRFSSELQALPKGATHRENKTWRIAGSRFLKKERQRVYWINRITVESEVFRFEKFSPGLLGSLISSGPIQGAGPFGTLQLGEINQEHSKDLFLSTSFIPKSTSIIPNSISLSSSGGISDVEQVERKLVAKGKTIFDVTWTVTVSTARKLSRAVIGDIAFIETVWE